MQCAFYRLYACCTAAQRNVLRFSKPAFAARKFRNSNLTSAQVAITGEEDGHTYVSMTEGMLAMARSCEARPRHTTLLAQAQRFSDGVMVHTPFHACRLAAQFLTVQKGKHVSDDSTIYTGNFISQQMELTKMTAKFFVVDFMSA